MGLDSVNMLIPTESTILNIDIIIMIVILSFILLFIMITLNELIKSLEFHEGVTTNELKLSTTEGTLHKKDYFEILELKKSMYEYYIKGIYDNEIYIIKIDNQIFNEMKENKINKLYGGIVGKTFYAVLED